MSEEVEIKHGYTVILDKRYHAIGDPTDINTSDNDIYESTYVLLTDEEYLEINCCLCSNMPPRFIRLGDEGIVSVDKLVALFKDDESE